MKHPPQFARSLLVSTQASPQQVLPAAHPVVRQLTVPVQTPPVHACPAAHFLPHAPQLLMSLSSRTQVLAQRERPWPARQLQVPFKHWPL